MSFEYGRYGNPTTVVAEEKIRHVLMCFLLVGVWLLFMHMCD